MDQPPGEAAPPRARKLDNLQMLRALAAFSVVVLHAFHETQALSPVAGQPAIDWPGSHLVFGVDIFFVLSGFIMAHTAADDFGKPGAPMRFFRRRLARIAPLYWLLTSVLLVGAAIAPSLLNVPIGDLFHVVASYLFIPDARGLGEVRPVMALGWTLNYEMLFYVMFSLALLTPLEFGVPWLTLLMILLAIAHVVIDPDHIRLAFWTDPIILEFLFGVYVGLAVRTGVRLGVAPTLALVAVGLVGFVEISGPLDALPQFLRSGVPAALLVLAAALGPTIPQTRVAAAIVAIGDASYSLYLSHPFVLRPARVLWAKAIGGHLPLALFVPAAAAVSVVAALALYAFAERPLTAWAQGWLCARSSPRRPSPRLVSASPGDA